MRALSCVRSWRTKISALSGRGVGVLPCLALALVSTTLAAEPNFRAHAHNDYLHARPLQDALEHGFWSVEADIWLVEGQLLIGHELGATTRDKTLQRIYLDPLRAFAKTNRPAKTAPPFTLLVDVKSDAEAAWAVLREVLTNYADVLTRFEAERVHTNAIMVIISGNRAQAAMRAEPVRFAALDGRLPDLESNPPVALIPLISDNWTRHFQWRGNGGFPDDERAKLRQIVERTQKQGRRLRFWAAPDNAAAWKERFDAGVDL
ncbi:MAG: phosphatidylinositol-specific phospholipase C/glycerophosphodiester phosphodiesterase family protein [Verrucomicrobiales bacterium]